MNKKILIGIIVLVMATTVFGCAKNKTSVDSETTKAPTVAPTQKVTSEVIVAEETATQETATQEQEVMIHEDMEFMFRFLEGGRLLSMENTEDMAENQGSEFGDIAKKQMGSGGYEFTFDPNTNEHLPLLKKLDEYEGATPLGGQAIFLRFKTTTAGIYFSFLGDNDFGVYFGNEGQPLVFTYTESSPFAVEGELQLEVNKWYNMLMAMASDGTFHCMMYLDDESNRLTVAKVALGETASGAGYKDQSWQFEIATHEQGAVTIEHYDVYTYTAFADE